MIEKTEGLIILADKNIRTAYGKLIKDLDNPLGAGKGLEDSQRTAQKEALNAKMRAAIQEKTMQLSNDANQARKRLATRQGMGTSTGGSGNNGFKKGSMKVS